jgi:anti-sigma regulatory factor (Ser/Thr protein kinase)
MANDVEFDTEGTMRNFISAYEMAEEEEPAIVFIEAIANSIDAHTKEIQISLRQKQDGRGVIKISDNGDGMTDTILKANYHRFSVSTKEKAEGQGIGFAGVGAKLALYFDKDAEVRTTTKSANGEVLCTLMRWNKASNKLEWDYTRAYNNDKEFLISKKQGTIYEIDLNKDQWKFFQSSLSDIIKKWYNSLLLGHYNIDIIVNGKKLGAKQINVKDGMSFSKQIKVCGEDVKFHFYILENGEEFDNDEKGMNFIVYGKYIKTDKINWGGRIKPEYEDKIYALVEADGLATELVFNKRNFRDRAKKYRETKKRCETELSIWLNSMGALRETASLAPTKRMRELAAQLSELLNNKDFKDFNPFLRRLNRSTLFEDPTGTETGTLIDGSQISTGTKGGGSGGGGSDVLGDDENNTVPVLDDKGDTKLEEHKRNIKGIVIIRDDKVENDNRESWVDHRRKAIIINELHMFYKAANKSNNKDVKDMQLVKAMVDALAYDVADKPEFANNYREISDKKLNLVIALMNKT